LISVIVTTSPGREANLAACLQLLSQQSLPAQEVIVVDDGSVQGQATAQAYQICLPLQYLWRPNDCSVALSRNLGAQAASGTYLVFLDSDMLLNPNGLAAYAEAFRDFPQLAFYGYFGYQLELVGPSFFLPTRQVMWCDRRFDAYHRTGLVPAYNMIRFPHEWAWSGNFALSRQVYEQVQGFDSRFRGWGGEDLDFAWRLLSAGYQLHFFLDAWAEQQTHERQERFHTWADTQREVIYQSRYQHANYRVQILHSPTAWKQLSHVIFEYYAKTVREWPVHPEFQPVHRPPPESGPGNAGSKA